MQSVLFLPWNLIKLSFNHLALSVYLEIMQICVEILVLVATALVLQADEIFFFIIIYKYSIVSICKDIQFFNVTVKWHKSRNVCFA